MPGSIDPSFIMPLVQLADDNNVTREDESIHNRSNDNDDVLIQKQPTIAKEHTLDLPRVPSLEVPLLVSKNNESINKAINMCGGIKTVVNVLNSKQNINTQSKEQNDLELRFNDSSEFFNEHPITGKKVPFRDESIILKITMPKGTMNKNDGSIRKSLDSLTKDQYTVSPVGIVDRTIKFREMSDFQYRLNNAPTAKEFSQSFGDLDWNNLKEFIDSVPDNDKTPYDNIYNITIDRTNKFPSFDFQLPPAPKLSMVNFPHLYNYKSNPLATKKANGLTEVKGSYIKNYQLFVHDLNDDTHIPIKPHEKLEKDYNIAKETGTYPGTKSESQFFESLEKCLTILDRLFDKRPIWVKRHIDGIIPKDFHHTLKIALALKSYRFTMGPWRNTYIKLGIDPRTSSEYAKYQTEFFKIERKLLQSPMVKKNVPPPPPTVFESNIPMDIDTRFRFNGSEIPWYLMLQIDLLIDEPNIAEIYGKAEYLNKVNEITGWFNELDLTKIRRIVKYELGCLVQGNHEFNQYKLKYFKTMLYAKESMMTNGENDNTTNTDADGDVEMPDSLSSMANKEQEDVDDDDNGVAAGDVAEDILEGEESNDEGNVRVDSDGYDENDDNLENEDGDEMFDVTKASFKDIIERIDKFDPETAKRLHNNLNGVINESNI